MAVYNVVVVGVVVWHFNELRLIDNWRICYTTKPTLFYEDSSEALASYKSAIGF